MRKTWTGSGLLAARANPSEAAAAAVANAAATGTRDHRRRSSGARKTEDSAVAVAVAPSPSRGGRPRSGFHGPPRSRRLATTLALLGIDRQVSGSNPNPRLPAGRI